MTGSGTPRPSIIYSAVVVVGLLLSVAGAVCALMGVGGVTAFGGKIGDVEVSTTSTGLAVLAIGAAMALVAVTRKPADVQLFSGASKPDALDGLRLPLFVAAVVAAGLLLVSLLA